MQVAAGSPTVGPIGLQPPLILYGNAETEFYVSTTYIARLVQTAQL